MQLKWIRNNIMLLSFPSINMKGKMVYEGNKLGLHLKPNNLHKGLAMIDCQDGENWKWLIVKVQKWLTNGS